MTEKAKKKLWSLKTKNIQTKGQKYTWWPVIQLFWQENMKEMTTHSSDANAMTLTITLKQSIV